MSGESSRMAAPQAAIAARTPKSCPARPLGRDEPGPDPEVTLVPHVPPGARLDGLRNNYSRLAGAQAFAPEPGQARAKAREAIAKLRVVVHAPPAEPDCF